MDFDFFEFLDFSTPLHTALTIYAIIVYIITVIAEWRILVKAGEKGWKSLIPFYNLYISHEIVGMAATWFILEVVFWVIELTLETLEEIVELPPEIALFFGSIIGAFTVLSEVIHIIKLCKCFGKGRIFTIGMIIIPYVFSAIIAFDRSVYTMPQNAHHRKEET